MAKRFLPFDDDPAEQAKMRRWPKILIALGSLIVLANVAMIATCEASRTPGPEPPCPLNDVGFCLSEKAIVSVAWDIGILGALIGLFVLVAGIIAKRRYASRS